MKLKAGKDFASLKNKHFKSHKINALLSGEVIDITEPDNIPEDVMKTLEEVKEKPKKETKKEAK